jgi:hypothetical protein
MARNPYAGLGASTDPYTNGNGYGAPAPSRTSEDYDPYGDVYGTPLTPSTSADRERPAGRSGGYGGFYDSGSGPAPAVQPAPQQQDRYDGYGRQSEDEPPPPRASPNRRPMISERSSARGYRQDRSDTDLEGSRSSRAPEYRRGGGERAFSSTNGSSNDAIIPRIRGDLGRGGGDGTRQIDGK